MSEARGNKPYKITVTIWIQAPYGYTSRLVETIRRWIRRTISHKKLSDISILWEDLSK